MDESKIRLIALEEIQKNDRRRNAIDFWDVWNMLLILFVLSTFFWDYTETKAKLRKLEQSQIRTNAK